MVPTLLRFGRPDCAQSPAGLGSADLPGAIAEVCLAIRMAFVWFVPALYGGRTSLFPKFTCTPVCRAARCCGADGGDVLPLTALRGVLAPVAAGSHRGVVKDRRRLPGRGWVSHPAGT